MVNAESIKNFFKMLNDEKIIYVLIKNDGNLIPYSVEDGKDVDILVHPTHYDLFLDTVLKADFERLPGESKKYFFLYKMRSDIYIHKNSAYFHAYDKLSCVSFTNMGLSKIPLDNSIQNYIWKNRVWDEKNSWWIADDKIILLYLIVRSIFDKKKFRESYIKEIELRRKFLNDVDFFYLCEPVFFRYTGRLLHLIEEKKYADILRDYQHFCDY